MRNVPIRVLQLRDSPWVDGPARTILETAARIDANRVEYHIAPLVSRMADLHPFVTEGLNRNLSVHPLHDSGGIDRDLASRATELIDALSIECLHSAEFRTDLLALVCKARRPHLKIIATVHGWIENDVYSRLACLVDRVALRYFDRVIMVSNAMRSRLPEWWLPGDRVEVLHNGLMFDSYGVKIDAINHARLRASKTVRVLNVGRLSPEKGQAVLIRAFAKALKEGFDLHLTLAGIGGSEAQLRAEAQKLGVSDRIAFAGYVSDMPELYLSSDVVVQSSFTEGLPNVILEAAYLKVPVIATDVGGTSEVLVHDEHAWLIPHKSVAALYQALEFFCRDPESFRQRAERAYCRVMRRFSIEDRTARLTNLYEAICRTRA